MRKLKLRKESLRMISTESIGGGADSDSCTMPPGCTGGICGWDSDIVKLREGGGGKESK